MVESYLMKHYEFRFVLSNCFIGESNCFGLDWIGLNGLKAGAEKGSPYSNSKLSYVSWGRLAIDSCTLNAAPSIVCYRKIYSSPFA